MQAIHVKYIYLQSHFGSCAQLKLYVIYIIILNFVRLFENDKPALTNISQNKTAYDIIYDMNLKTACLWFFNCRQIKHHVEIPSKHARRCFNWDRTGLVMAGYGMFTGYHLLILWEMLCKWLFHAVHLLSLICFLKYCSFYITLFNQPDML